MKSIRFLCIFHVLSYLSSRQWSLRGWKVNFKMLQLMQPWEGNMATGSSFIPKDFCTYHLNLSIHWQTHKRPSHVGSEYSLCIVTMCANSGNSLLYNNITYCTQHILQVLRLITECEIVPETSSQLLQVFGQTTPKVFTDDPQSVL